jgi:hypothetical protein
MRIALRCVDDNDRLARTHSSRSLTDLFSRENPLMYSHTARFGATALLIGAALLTPVLAHAQNPTRPPTPPATPPATSPTSPTTPTSPAAPATKTGTAAGSVASSLGASACTITINGAAVRAGAAEVTVDASLSSAIGDSISASFPMASKISVLSVAPADPANTVRLTLNASAAAPGEYTVSLKGTKGECSGKVKVASDL